MHRRRDPESIAHARESADWGQFEVAIIHEEHGELGTLNKTFNNDYDASVAARKSKISAVGINAEIRDITDESD